MLPCAQHAHKLCCIFYYCHIPYCVAVFVVVEDDGRRNVGLSLVADALVVAAPAFVLAEVGAGVAAVVVAVSVAPFDFVSAVGGGDVVNRGAAGMVSPTVDFNIDLSWLIVCLSI